MIQEKLQQATFKGVPFFWRRLNTQLGKKSVSHNYPGTSRRFVEDMGQLPKTFTIEASITGAIGSDEYLQRKQALENALSSPGAGFLVHPSYGRVLVTAKPASCTEEVKRLGEARYSLTFERSEEISRPVGNISTARQIELSRQQALSEIIDVSSESWTVPESPGVFNVVSQNIQGLADQMNEVVAVVSAPREDAYQVFASIESLKTSASNLITEPLALFNSIKGIFDQVLNMDDEFESQLDRLTGFFGDSADSGPGQVEAVGNQINPISYETQGAEDNRVAQNEASNMMALVNAYSSISKIDFQSTDQLDDFVERLETQFSIMTGCNLMQTPLRDTVLNLRLTSRNVIEQKRLLTQDVITADFKVEIPLNVALFMYSGNIDDSAYVLSLNPDQDPVFAVGGVELLQ